MPGAQARVEELRPGFRRPNSEAGIPEAPQPPETPPAVRRGPLSRRASRSGLPLSALDGLPLSPRSPTPASGDRGAQVRSSGRKARLGDTASSEKNPAWKRFPRLVAGNDERLRRMIARQRPGPGSMASERRQRPSPVEGIGATATAGPGVEASERRQRCSRGRRHRSCGSARSWGRGHWSCGSPESGERAALKSRCPRGGRVARRSGRFGRVALAAAAGRESAVQAVAVSAERSRSSAEDSDASNPPSRPPPSRA